jgi:hypothetical protein
MKIRFTIIGLAVCACLSQFSCSSKKIPYDAELVEKPTHDYHCTPSKEFITTVNYLRDQEALALKNEDLQKTALDVSAGCRGAAQRFIRVSRLLIKSNLDSNSALATAKEIALRDDNDADAFITIFKYAYADDYLDLNIAEALNLARSFSVAYKGKPSLAEKDFEALAEYCVDKKELAFERPRCVELTTSLTRLGEKYEAPIAKNFIATVKFLREGKDSPNLKVDDAVKLATELISISPDAPNNFELAYAFSSSPKGLKLSKAQAIDMAKKIATNATVQIHAAKKLSQTN